MTLTPTLTPTTNLDSSTNTIQIQKEGVMAVDGIQFIVGHCLIAC